MCFSLLCKPQHVHALKQRKMLKFYLQRGGALSFNSFTRSNQEYLNNACGASIAFNSTGVFGPSGLKDKLPPFELVPRSNLMELEM